VKFLYIVGPPLSALTAAALAEACSLFAAPALKGDLK
jgi:hypothetical protein